VPIDPHSLQMAPDLDWRWYDDKAFMKRLGATLSPGEVKAEQYSAIYYTGGHGVMWDFPDNQPLQDLARRIYEAGGVVASVCQGAVGLLNVKAQRQHPVAQRAKRDRFLQYRRETGRAGQGGALPHRERTGARGGEYQKAEDPWAPFVVEDGSLITGQNPASTAGVAQAVLKCLAKRKLAESIAGQVGSHTDATCPAMTALS
jgi:putative intracellular protease/amidase